MDPAGSHTTKKLPGEFVLPVPAPPLAPVPPPVSLGNYTLVEELGRGGMGAVWRARDGAGREVALKLLAHGWSEEDLVRFQREAALSRGLTHEGIVQVLDWGIDRGTPFLVMELIQGESLERRIARTGPLPPQEAAGVAMDVARALAHAHARGVLHRDVKPGNVLLDGMGRARLVDFGLARRLTAEESQALTQSGVALGTPATMAPEQARGERDLDGRTDVYGIGATLYWALTGRPPFEGRTWITTMRKAIEESPPRPSSHQAGIDPALEALCLRCLEKAPGDRYPGARELAAALSEWLRTSRRGGGGRSAAALAFGAGGLAALGLAWVVLGGGEVARSPAPAPLATPGTERQPAPSPPAERRLTPALAARDARARTRVERSPRSVAAVEAWLDRARVAALGGLAERAQEHLAAAEEVLAALEPDASQEEGVLLARARLLAERGAWERAIETLVARSRGTTPAIAVGRLSELLGAYPATAEQLLAAASVVRAARRPGALEEARILAFMEALLLAEAGRPAEGRETLAGEGDLVQLLGCCLQADRLAAALALLDAAPSPAPPEIRESLLHGLARWDDLRRQLEARGGESGQDLVRLAAATRYAGHYQQALELFQRALEAGVPRHQVDFNLAGTLNSLDRWEEALEVYARVAGPCAGVSVVARYRRCETLLHQGRPLEEAEAELRTVPEQELRKVPEGYNQWIRVLTAQGRDAEARGRLAELQALAEDPDANPDAIEMLRRAPRFRIWGLAVAGRLTEARAELAALRVAGSDLDLDEIAADLRTWEQRLETWGRRWR